MGSARDTVKTIRFTQVEADLLEQSAAAHNMSVSDVVRQAIVQWRENVGDRAAALDAWVNRLLAEHGAHAVLAVRVNDRFSVDVEVDGREPDDFDAQAVFDGAKQVQLWVGDPATDARAFLGRVPAISGAGVVIPLRSVAGLGASDAHAV